MSQSLGCEWHQIKRQLARSRYADDAVSSSGRFTALVLHDDGSVLDFLTRWLEASGLDVVSALGSYRAKTHLEGERAIDVVIAPWDATHALGGDVYRWVLAHRTDLRTRFVFIADEVPPEFDAVVGGRCLAVPLSATEIRASDGWGAGIDELVRVALAVVRRVRTPPLGLPISTDRPSLLLVDDDPILLGVMADFLTEAGYAVTQAESGSEASTLLETGEFDAIVTDWHMHDGSGADLYRWILQVRPALAPRVVFLSEADGDDSAPVAPGRPMLRKGQDSQALSAALRDIVNAARG